MNKRGLAVLAGILAVVFGFAQVSFAQAAPSAPATSEKPAAKPVELPSWIQGLKFSGDMRVRYEGIWFDETDKDYVDQQHGRFRLRFGVEKQITDEWLAAFRLASGKDSGPTSTNQTLTNNFDKKLVWIDLAYITYKPNTVPGLAIGAGKVKNPWANTFMVWDPDVNPEGVYATYKTKVADNFEPFVTISEMFSFENANLGADDASMWAAQGGFNWSIMEGVTWSPSLAYYDWQSYCKKGNWSKSNGNTTDAGKTILTAGDFKVVDIISTLKFKVFDMPLAITADYARNTGDDAPAPDNGLDTAYAGIIKLGDVKDPGQWSLDYTYAKIEANAVVGAFADSDFGYANRKGHKIGFSYGLAKNVVGGLSLYITKPDSGSDKTEQTTLMADVTLSF